MKIILAVTAAVIAATSMSAPALAKNKKEPIVLPAPPEGKGQIVFFRNGGQGFVMGCAVHENGEKVSSLGAGRYFIMATDPGRHEFTAKSEAKDVLALEVEEDETQFVRCRIKMGILMGRPDISPSDEAAFRKKNLKMVDEDDMGPAPGALRPSDLVEKSASVLPTAEPELVTEEEEGRTADSAAETEE